jgi:hypothetical protein
MPSITLRLPLGDKKKLAAEARRRGLSLSKFLREAAAREIERSQGSWATFFEEHPPRDIDGPSDLSTREGFGS